MVRHSIGLDDALAIRVADVLRRGLYEVVPDEDAVQAMIDDDPDAPPVDLRGAASLLRCERTRNGLGSPLPDVRIDWTCARWIHYDGIAEGEPMHERIQAVGREHAQYAAEVLEAPLADDARIDAIRETMHCVAASVSGMPAEHEPLVVDAATPWAPLMLMQDEYDALGSTTQPDDDLCRACPHLVRAGISRPTGSDRPVILIEAFQSHLHRDEMPDPMDVMRTILTLRSRS